jgi:hypothetical protein
MNEAAVVRRLRASLIGSADTSAGWRYRKAREFPWDARNVESGKSLRRLNAALAALPPDHELWGRYAAVWSRAGDDDCPRLFEIEHAMLEAYGFSIHGAPGSADKFLLELLTALELELAGSAHADLLEGDREEPAPRIGVIDAFPEAEARHVVG